MPMLSSQQAQTVRNALARRTLADNQNIRGEALQAALQEISLPWIEKPAGGIDFDQLNVVAVVLPAVGAQVVVITFVVPRGMNGVIKRVSNQFVGGGWTEGTGDLVWRIQLDGLPARNYDNIIASLGSMTNPANFGNGGILLKENQLVELIALNVVIVPAAQPLLGRLGGWFYPIEFEPAGGKVWF